LFEILPKKVCVSLHDLGKCISTLSAEGILDLSDEEAKIYAFQNELIRKTLMEFVLPSDADIIHKNTAHAFERLFKGSLRPHYASLSYHYAMSPIEERGKAFKYTVNAADQQIGIGNFQAGYSYLEYAASFVKYDTEMNILSKVTVAAFFDLKLQQKSKSTDALFTIEDVCHFEDMNDKFSNAVTTGIINGSVILQSGSFDHQFDPIGSLSSIDSQLETHVDGSSGSLSDKPSPIQRSKSAYNAKLLKMPSYSANHVVHHKSKTSKACCHSCVMS
jgi:hypothetical protein